MLTTFFGPHRFGGDAVYVDRLSRALMGAGHEVHVIYSVDAFETVRGREPLKAYTPPEGLHMHPIKSRPKMLASIWSHQTGTLGPMRKDIETILSKYHFDVLHFHNISLLGGPDILRVKTNNRRAVRLMSVHEFWLICPMSLLWKFDRKVCDTPECAACCLKGRRPLQPWRATSMLKRSLSHIDALLFPSGHTLKIHKEHSILHRRMIHLPYFLPDDWAGKSNGQTASDKDTRPYFAMAGRLVKEKGFQDVIAVMPLFADFDLKIAGTGPYFDTLFKQARGMKNVQFLGQLSFTELEPLFRGARALILPSLFYETFGYVILEAFYTKTPVIVAGHGAAAELPTQARAGFTFKNRAGLVAAMEKLAKDKYLAEQLGKNGRKTLCSLWSEKKTIQKYLSIISDIATNQAVDSRDNA